jgi:hypothetical protein
MLHHEIDDQGQRSIGLHPQGSGRLSRLPLP